MKDRWQESYAQGVPKSITFDDITLPEALRRSAQRFPERPALMFEGTTLTYRELENAVSRLASALGSLGVESGTSVSFLLPNLVQTAVGIYGSLYAGAQVVMHDPRLDPVQMIYQLNDAGSEVVFCLDVLVPSLKKLQPKTRIQKIITCHIRDHLSPLKWAPFPLVKKQLNLVTAGIEGVLEFSDLVDGSQPQLRVEPVPMDETAFILYTSGTTGRPKGVELTHRNVSRNVQQIRSWFPSFREGAESVAACLPFFHVFGLTCALNLAVRYGWNVGLIPGPDPLSILKAVDSYKASVLGARPTTYTAILNDPSLKKYSLKSLKACFSGGAPLPLDTLNFFEKLTGVRICEGYGLTECSPVTHINPFAGKTKIGTIGLPLPETECKVVDVDDPGMEITNPGTPGELCVRGPQVMKGYLNLPDRTKLALRDGWLLTGDVVTFDQEGYFTVVDRKHDMIVSNGHRIFPRHVDEVLFSYPKVLEACTIGVPDQETGQSVKSHVVIKKGEVASEQEIIGYCRTRLPDHMVPATIEFETELPRSLVGKILRKELKRKVALKAFTQSRRESA